MEMKEKIGLDGRVGNRFEPMPITPRQMVEVLDSDESKIKGLAIGGTTYKPSARFYKTLAAELGIPYGVLLRRAPPVSVPCRAFRRASGRD